MKDKINKTSEKKDPITVRYNGEWKLIDSGHRELFFHTNAKKYLFSIPNAKQLNTYIQNLHNRNYNAAPTSKWYSKVYTGIKERGLATIRHKLASLPFHGVGLGNVVSFIIAEMEDQENYTQLGAGLICIAIGIVFNMFAFQGYITERESELIKIILDNIEAAEKEIAEKKKALNKLVKFLKSDLTANDYSEVFYQIMEAQHDHAVFINLIDNLRLLKDLKEIEDIDADIFIAAFLKYKLVASELFPNIDLSTSHSIADLYNTFKDRSNVELINFLKILLEIFINKEKFLTIILLGRFFEKFNIKNEALKYIFLKLDKKTEQKNFFLQIITNLEVLLGIRTSILPNNLFEKIKAVNEATNEDGLKISSNSFVKCLSSEVFGHMLANYSGILINQFGTQKKHALRKEQDGKACVTRGDGNCFFHAALGLWDGTEYVLSNAQLLREELVNFLRQFSSLADKSMPQILKERLTVILYAFYDNPNLLFKKGYIQKEEFTIFASAIIQAAEEGRNAKEASMALVTSIKQDVLNDTVNEEINSVLYSLLYNIFCNIEIREEYQIIQKQLMELKDKLFHGDSFTVEKLIKNRKEFVEILKNNPNYLEDKIRSDLCQYAMSYQPSIYKTEVICKGILDTETRIKQYFIENENIYTAYLNALKSKDYYIFTEEIPLLVALLNISLQLYSETNSQVYNFNSAAEEEIKQIHLEVSKNESWHKAMPTLWNYASEKTVAIYHSDSHYSRYEISSKLKEDKSLSHNLELKK